MGDFRAATHDSAQGREEDRSPTEVAYRARIDGVMGTVLNCAAATVHVGDTRPHVERKLSTERRRARHGLYSLLLEPIVAEVHVSTDHAFFRSTRHGDRLMMKEI